MRIKAVLTIAFLLSGCAGSPPVDLAVAPPPSLLVPCAAPVRLKDAALSSRDIEIGWGRDRAALRACGSKQAALANYLEGRQ